MDDAGSSASPQDDCADAQLFTSIGLDAKRVKDTLKNPVLTKTLLAVIHEAELAETGCERKVGNLLYSIATELPEESIGHRSVMLKFYIKSQKIKGKEQLMAAFRYLASIVKDGLALDWAEFEKACGVGVEIPPEKYNEVAKSLVGNNPSARIGTLMKMMTEQLPWGDRSLMQAELRKLVSSDISGKKHAESQGSAEVKKASSQEKRVVQSDLVSQSQEFSETVTAKICQLVSLAEAHSRVRVFGWAHHLRPGGSAGKLMFVELRDGTGFLQCVISGQLAVKAQSLHRESALVVCGTLSKFPPKHHPPEYPGVLNYELQVDSWSLIGESDLDFERAFNVDSSVSQRLDLRHLVLRGPRASSVMRLKSHLLQALRTYYFEQNFVEVVPPTIVQTACEGGSELFSFSYFGEQAYLTQSSQLYLETVLPSLGDVFCVASSYRAEESRTPRHLAEYQHLEAELAFITFDELLDHIEDLLCSVVDSLLSRFTERRLISFLNPSFKPPQRPFERMAHSQAIDFCNAHGIVNQYGKPFSSGEDITEKPEREMMEIIGRPMFLIRFPFEMKAFYMARCNDDTNLTESVDLLLPGVGEIFGGSMRENNLGTLLAGFESKHIDSELYYWYTDQRRFGTQPHGGYGIGIERLMMWLAGESHIRDTCLYPRTSGRAKP